MPSSAPYTLDPGNRSIRAQKHALRVHLGNRQKTIPADLQNTTGWKATNHLRTLLAGMKPGIVALYYPRQNQINTFSLAQELWASGNSIALPRRIYRGHPLVFNLWSPEDTLEPDITGTPCATGPEVWPGTIIIPMVGYNRRGYRLGEGADDYNTTLKHAPLPATTIGLCYTELEIPEFPKEYHDQRLGYIVTGKEVITCI